MVFLWIAQFFSQFGDSVFQLAFIWLILDLTGSKSATGIAATISYLPSLVFGVGAGLLVDRWNRRLVMIGADAARAALLAVASLLFFAGALTPALLTALAFGVATAAVLFYPARDAMLPDLVPSEGLNRANAFVQLSQQGAFFAGPMVAGYLIKQYGVASAFPTGAIFFLGSLGALLFLRIERSSCSSPSPRSTTSSSWDPRSWVPRSWCGTPSTRTRRPSPWSRRPTAWR
jgi:MFS transporter, DHA3 family, macrolide efflux protein